MITQPANLLSFLNELRDAKIHYRIGNARDEATLVEVAVPGERWEVEFFEDGTVEVEVFLSSGEIRGSEALADLLTKYAS